MSRRHLAAPKNRARPRWRSCSCSEMLSQERRTTDEQHRQKGHGRNQHAHGVPIPQYCAKTGKHINCRTAEAATSMARAWRAITEERSGNPTHQQFRMAAQCGMRTSPPRTVRREQRAVERAQTEDRTNGTTKFRQHMTRTQTAHSAHSRTATARCSLLDAR